MAVMTASRYLLELEMVDWMVEPTLTDSEMAESLGLWNNLDRQKAERMAHQTRTEIGKVD